MDWQQIVAKLRLIKEHFDRSYKCLNTDRATKGETVEKHLKVLFDRFEEIRVLLNVNYNRLTVSHQSAAENFFADVRGKLAGVLSRRGLEVKLPVTLHEAVSYRIEDQVDSDPELGTVKLGVDTKTPLLPITGGSNTVDDKEATMPQTITEFLGLASKLLPDFDGKPENLRSFLDALTLLDSVKDTHEAVAINLIKTKLKGTARNLISDESTINNVIATLTGNVKGESVEVIQAKLMNVRQGGKNANAYVSEIESLTRSLESAYISDGLSQQLAQRYTTQAAVKAITRNATNERVKLIMESGTFTNMNEVTAKFVNSCTEAYGQQNSVLFTGSNRGTAFNSRNRGRGYRRQYAGNNRGQYNNYHGNGRGNHNGTNNGNGYNNNRGRGRSNNNGSRHNVRHVAENISENEPVPLN